MSRLQRRNFDAAPQKRDLGHGRFDVVDLDETAVGRMTLEPGWRWSTDVAPKVGTTSCQIRHLGAVVRGQLHIVVDDGAEMDIRAGDAYEIPPGHDAWVVGDTPWEAVEFASARVFGATGGTPDVHMLGTILMTDIVGSTAALERVGDARWHSILLAHNEQLRAQIDRFDGREVRTTGDGFQVLFTGAARGVRCAAAMVDAVEDLGIQIRAGLHTGEVELIAGSLHGIAVHAAARVSALAGPSEVLVSAVTRDLLDGSGLVFEERGVHELKGLTGARPVFALVRAP
ncbi:MAG: adenylate/guanylate cyclase domain-containing protein [Chloroflexota bacterium]